LNKLVIFLSKSVLGLCFQVEKIEESFDLINAKPKPLAAYLFTKNRKLQEEFVASVPAGGMLVNDTALHVSSASSETL
jgi:acyl-CoA reductase-like NAD-dependent aldehyde dehydrogenase